MVQTTTGKKSIIQKTRIGSVGIGVFYGLLAAFNLKRGIALLSDLMNTEEYVFGSILYYIITYALLGIALLLAALMFLRVAKEGMPFQKKNVRLVRIIGILYFAIAVVPALIASCIAKEPTLLTYILSNLHSIFEGLVLLMIGQILHYGTMLQQASDETL